MDTITPATARAYVAHVDYLSGGEAFARETFTIEVVDGLDPYQIARSGAERHPYADMRIPSLSIVIALHPEDPEDPEPRPPSGALMPTCPRCGGDSLVRDAAANWNSDRQEWVLAGVQDCETCNDCGAEADDLAHCGPLPSRAPADRYLRELAVALRQPELIENVHFQRFCLNAHSSFEIARAVAEWPGSA